MVRELGLKRRKTVWSLSVVSIIKIKIFKFAFVHLRYFLGGDRPSQTTSHKLSFNKLVKSNFKNGISLLLALPPILHKLYSSAT